MALSPPDPGRLSIAPNGSSEALSRSLTARWEIAPDQTALGTERSGTLAAIWQSKGVEAREFRAEPDPIHHLLAFPLSEYHDRSTIDDQTRFSRPVRPGGFQLIQRGERPWSEVKGHWRTLHVYLSAQMIDDMAIESGLVTDASALTLIDPRTEPSASAADMARRMVRVVEHGDGLTALELDTVGLMICINLLREHSNLRHSGSKLSKGGLASWQERRVTEYMRSHFAENIRLRELAALVGLSENHFCRAFAQSMGEPPHRYLSRIRVERAQILLQQRASPIAEIALQVGYGNQSSFTVAFRRVTGTTPLTWRRERSDT